MNKPTDLDPAITYRTVKYRTSASESQIEKAVPDTNNIRNNNDSKGFSKDIKDKKIITDIKIKENSTIPSKSQHKEVKNHETQLFKQTDTLLSKLNQVSDKHKVTENSEAMNLLGKNNQKNKSAFDAFIENLMLYGVKGNILSINKFKTVT